MRKLVFLSVFLLFCSSVSAVSQAEQSNEALMIQYGEALRYAYRTDDRNFTSSERFLDIEAELEARGLIDKQIVSQIERGIVYVGMPLTLALASMESLREVDTMILERSLIRSFQGPTQPVRRSGYFDTIIACDNVVVALFAARTLITRETYNQVFGSGRIRFQTNFRNGFWAEDNFEERIRGNRVFNEADDWGDRSDHRWSMFSNNSGSFSPPSLWQDTGANNWGTPRDRININDMMHSHIRRGLPICE